MSNMSVPIYGIRKKKGPDNLVALIAQYTQFRHIMALRGLIRDFLSISTCYSVSSLTH